MRVMPPLTSSRLTIRAFTASDLDAAVAVFDIGYSDRTATTPEAIGKRQAWLDYIIANAQQLATLDQPPYGERAIVDTASQQVIGAIGFVPCVDQFGLVGIGHNDGYSHAEVGLFWTIIPTHRRQGYASEAARMMIDYAVGSLGLRRIIATTEHDNIASQGVMRSAGMDIRTNPHDQPHWLQVVGVYETQRRFELLANGMTLRPITLSDLSPLIALWRLAGLKISPTDTITGLRRHIGVSGNLALALCVPDGTIIGSVLGSDDGRRGWINHLAIHPDYQGQGLGRLLITTITARLKAQGCEKINLLITGPNQKVIPFYQANGFGFDDIIYMTKWMHDDV
jgi:[ribosomal protein S5]-alanine N-acetyltransferase